LIAAAALAFAASGAFADDQTTTISQQGDALARAKSAQALVKPMPAFPPNSPSNVSTAAVAHGPAAAAPPVSGANGAPVPPTGTAFPPAPNAPPAITTVAGTASVPVQPSPTAPTAPPSGFHKAVLIAVGAFFALGLFLWERRKGGP
jgi:hypothetical protein